MIKIRNFQISYLVLIMLCIGISGCTAQSVNLDMLVGKWKVVNSEGEILQVMTVKNDSTITVLLSDLGTDIFFRLEYLDEKKLSMIKVEEGIEKTSENKNKRMLSIISEESEEKSYMEYIVDSTSLIIGSISNSTRFVRCENGICDFEQEYFIKRGMYVHELNLPLTSINNLSKLTGREVNIYFGPPKKRYETIYGSNARLSNGKNFITINELPLMIEKEKVRIERRLDEKIEILLHIDSDIEIFEVNQLLINMRLDRLGIETVNCAVLVNDETVKSEAEVMKTNQLMELLEEIGARFDSSISIQEWITENE